MRMGEEVHQRSCSTLGRIGWPYISFGFTHGCEWHIDMVLRASAWGDEGQPPTPRPSDNSPKQRAEFHASHLFSPRPTTQHQSPTTSPPCTAIYTLSTTPVFWKRQPGTKLTRRQGRVHTKDCSTSRAGRTKMRLTVELIQGSLSYLNALNERELDLRGAYTEKDRYYSLNHEHR